MSKNYWKWLENVPLTAILPAMMIALIVMMSILSIDGAVWRITNSEGFMKYIWAIFLSFFLSMAAYLIHAFMLEIKMMIEAEKEYKKELSKKKEEETEEW